MADSYERRRRRRGRYESGFSNPGPGTGTRADQDSFSQTQHSQPHQHQAKPPMKILGLAKPSRLPTEVTSPSKGENIERNDDIHQQPPEGVDDKVKFRGPSTTATLATNIPREDNLLSSPSSSKSNNVVSAGEYSRSSGEGPTMTDNNLSYSQLKRQPPVPSTVTASNDSSGHYPTAKLAPPVERQFKLKLIDETLHWVESSLEFLLDQTDFLVVGVVGLQGCGKSTILSLLAGTSQQDAYRNYVFTPQSKEVKEEASFQTSGIDMFVTPERIIYLDCQPMLSPAVMESLLRFEKKLPMDCSSLQNLVEMQSMQLLTFLLSVCNTVIIVDDWFVDVNLLRFVQDAEMLKLSQPPSMSSSSDNPSNKEETSEFFPTVVFVHNKATRQDFSPDTYHSMQTVLSCVFSSSKLRYKTGINMNSNIGEAIIPKVPGKDHLGISDTNLILLPPFEFYKCDPECLESILPDYRGYPSFGSIFSLFRSQILSAPRSPLTHNALTEKSWYHFAARIWESMKKSSLLSEYNRLLSAT